MDWHKADDADQIYIPGSQDLTGYDDSDLEMGNDSQPEIIDLDNYSPVRSHHQNDEVSCKNDVLVVFPDICPDYLAQLTRQHNYNPDNILSAILDDQEKTGSYPTQILPESNPLKRKRDSKSNELADDPSHARDHDNDDNSNSDDEGDPKFVRSIKLQIAGQEYSTIMRSSEYTTLARTLLSQEFPRVPQNFIRASLRPKSHPSDTSVFGIYTTIDEQIRNRDNANKLWQEKKTLTKVNPDFTPEKLENLDMNRYKPGEQAVFAEFIAARKLRAIKDAKIVADAEEHNNFLQAKKEGQTIDCGICFEECPLNRMVRCDGETMHWFCRKCLRTQAESLIGMAKYELVCMSLDGCSAGFSHGQRALFLNKKLTIALDRIEQEAMLRMAGIENLETCPFCPYAAEYPPVEVDKEFRCEDPRCQRVSCRLCRRETHIPKTCAEVDADRGLDARHILEEAMSEALIRRCNKCQNAFVKTDGCNKIRCTKCGTMQCDVCRKTITDYSHFNDATRGGKEGHCPLYDENQGRYEKEVSSAETEMRKKIVAENPDLDEEALYVPISEKVHQDTSKTVVPAFRPPLPVHFGRPPGNADAVRPRLDFLALPNDLNRAKEIQSIIPVARVADWPNPVPRPNAAMNIANAANVVVQEAQSTAKRKEAPIAFRMAGPARSNATQMPVPRPLSFGTRVRGKMENMTKLRFNDARYPDVEAKRPNSIPTPNPFLNAPPLNPPQHQGLVDPAQLQMGIHRPPFAAAPGTINGAASLANQAGPVEPLPPDWLNWDLFMREQQ